MFFVLLVCHGIFFQCKKKYAVAQKWLKNTDLRNMVLKEETNNKQKRKKLSVLCHVCLHTSLEFLRTLASESYRSSST